MEKERLPGPAVPNASHVTIPVASRPYVTEEATASSGPAVAQCGSGARREVTCPAGPGAQEGRPAWGSQTEVQPD